MGKATILSHLGNGQYRVRLLLDTARATAEKNDLAVKIEAITSFIEMLNEFIAALYVVADAIDEELKAFVAVSPEQTDKINQLQGEIAVINAEIENLRVLMGSVPEGSPQYMEYQTQLSAAEALLREKEALLRDVIAGPGSNAWAEIIKRSQLNDNEIMNAVNERDMLRLKKASFEKRKTYLQENIPDDPVVDIWCADRTLNLAADTEVGTAEVPGERGTVLILPGYGNYAAYNRERDGLLQPLISGTPAAAFYNLAMLPGWQKWMPGYRFGTITVLDKVNNTCTVDIEAAVSSQPYYNPPEKKFDVNYCTALANVPIDYMR